MGAAFPHRWVVGVWLGCCCAPQRDRPRARRARTWIIQHCPPINRLVLGDISLLSLQKSWDRVNMARGKAALV